ncbi:unnamed protein product [Discosporangium mesarthrocarpum]
MEKIFPSTKRRGEDLLVGTKKAPRRGLDLSPWGSNPAVGYGCHDKRNKESLFSSDARTCQLACMVLDLTVLSPGSRKSELVVWGITRDGRKACFRVKDFKFYFYFPAPVETEEEILAPDVQEESRGEEFIAGRVCRAVKEELERTLRERWGHGAIEAVSVEKKRPVMYYRPGQEFMSFLCVKLSFHKPALVKDAVAALQAMASRGVAGGLGGKGLRWPGESSPHAYEVWEGHRGRARALRHWRFFFLPLCMLHGSCNCSVSGDKAL